MSYMTVNQEKNGRNWEDGCIRPLPYPAPKPLQPRPLF